MNSQIFPQRPDQPFPRTFVDTVRTIFKRLFRVYAHIYHSHWDMMVSLGAEAHLNTCFKHFMYFTHAFALIDKKELAPLSGAHRRVSASAAAAADTDTDACRAAARTPHRPCRQPAPAVTPRRCEEFSRAVAASIYMCGRVRKEGEL